MPHHFSHFIHTAHHFETEYKQVFLYRTIRALGASVISVFVPIFIYQVTGSDAARAVPLITMYFVTVYAMRGLFTPISINLVSKIGGKHVLLWSSVLDAIAFLLLAFLDNSTTFLLVPIALLLASSNSMFFCALHMELSFSTGKRKAKEVSNVEIARKVTMSLGPLVGGLIAGSAGIFYATLLASALFLVSAIPLHLRDEPLKKIKPIDINELPGYLRSKACRSNFGIAFNTVSASLVWPLFIYLTIRTYESVGIIISVTLILTISLMHFLGLHEKQTETEKQLKAGTSAAAFTHTVRALAVNPVTISLVNFMNDISYSLIIVPYMSQYYRNANSYHRSSYVAAMEIYYAAGATCSWVFFYLVYVMSDSINAAILAVFLMAAIGSITGRSIVKPIPVKSAV